MFMVMVTKYFHLAFGDGYYIFLYISMHASLLFYGSLFHNHIQEISFKNYGSFPFEMLLLNPYGNAIKREDMHLLHSSYDLLKLYHS